ncbi:glucosaminidase domain-containing protein [Candidatus Saccharibacteria bacterium]|nr:glucosaminidase domain-containing protein [Candidatus Saccharibacteria bacterium]
MKRLALILLAALLAATPVFAAEENGYILDKSTMSKYDKNGIYYYNPNGGSNCISGSSAGKQITGVGYERVRQAVEIYGPAAMEAQRTFGTPWEVLIVQMQLESGTGTSDLALATNNWLGIRARKNAPNAYKTPNNGYFAKFNSVEESINAWAGKKVLRAGYYDEAFQYLDPNNYNLHEYLNKVIPIYAPSSDGNNPTAYIANIEKMIKEIVEPAAKKNGFPSSAELAKQENIQPGGKYPIGSEIPDDIDITAICATYSGDINATALAFSWPDRSHGPDDPKPEYREALSSTGIVGLGDSCSDIGKSCDAFVTAVMRASGADPDFYCCGAANVLNYLIKQTKAGKYIEIENIGSADNLEPGDIRSKSSHVEMYVEEDGVGKIASASHCDRTGDRGRNYYPDSTYRIFRRVK